MKLNARELRDLEEKNALGEIKEIKKNPIYFILENIYDTYNIGGLFRLADAIAVEKIYLCGETETPPNHKIKKASIGTYKIVNWQYCKTAKDAIDDLKSKVKSQKSKLQFKIQNLHGDRTSEVENPLAGGQKEKNNPTIKQYNNKTIKIIAVEQHKNSIPYTKAQYNFPVALIFGNESYGVLPETLKFVDQIVEIPMWGINKSLNVIVSAAIVSYWLMNKIAFQFFRQFR